MSNFKHVSGRIQKKISKFRVLFERKIKVEKNLSVKEKSMYIIGREVDAFKKILFFEFIFLGAKTNV